MSPFCHVLQFVLWSLTLSSECVASGNRQRRGAMNCQKRRGRRENGNFRFFCRQKRSPTVPFAEPEPAPPPTQRKPSLQAQQTSTRSVPRTPLSWYQTVVRSLSRGRRRETASSRVFKIRDSGRSNGPCSGGGVEIAPAS